MDTTDNVVDFIFSVDFPEYIDIELKNLILILTMSRRNLILGKQCPFRISSILGKILS